MTDPSRPLNSWHANVHHFFTTPLTDPQLINQMVLQLAMARYRSNASTVANAASVQQEKDDLRDCISYVQTMQSYHAPV
jgi:hypothetical protein